MKITIFSLFYSLSFVGFVQIQWHNPLSYQVNEVTAYSVQFSFSKVQHADMYLVLVSDNQIVNSIPNAGKNYMRGDNVGNAKVVQCSLDTLVKPRAVRANTMYYFVIYTRYKHDGNVQYVLEKPLNIQLTTPGLFSRDYYESISTSAPNFVANLSSLVTQHTIIPYASYKNTVLSMLEVQDTTAGRTFVQCAYTGERKIVELPFDWSKAGYSREHTYAHSWMPSNPANDPPLPEYSDLHNLFPTNLERANTIRSNFPFGEIDGPILYSYLEGRLGYAGAQIVYEPRDSHKGNAARALMYMAIAYNGVSSKSWQLPNFQDQQVLKKWHFQDPPDNYEIARQEYIFSLQGNRNPFIDHPEYACYIDFTKMIKMNEKCINSTIENKISKLEIQSDKSSFLVSSDEIITEIIVRDVRGVIIVHNFPTDSQFQIDNLSWKAGVYFIEVTLQGIKIVRRKIVLE